MTTTSTYTKLYPLMATLKERSCLSLPGSPKAIYHLVLEARDLSYEIGDSIGVIPRNTKQIVEATLEAMHASGDEIIYDSRHKESLSLREYLSRKANITTISRKLLELVAQNQSNPSKQQLLRELLDAENCVAMKTFTAKHHVWDFLLAHSEVSLPPEVLCQTMMPLLPRLYSVASSQSIVGEEIHLTVDHHQYISGNIQRYGVASHFLCQETSIGETSIPIYIQRSPHFRLPQDTNTPIIMVGAGTGIAPFRAFMQERSLSSNHNWLFFGQCTSAYDFYYKDFWQQLVDEKKLRLDTAFSRDQEHKIYVQHRLLEHGEELWRWLSQGASLYVCGDAKGMAKEVDIALHTIVQKYGNLTNEDAINYIRQLRSNKRYLRDIY